MSHDSRGTSAPQEPAGVRVVEWQMTHNLQRQQILLRSTVKFDPITRLDPTGPVIECSEVQKR